MLKWFFKMVMSLILLVVFAGICFIFLVYSGTASPAPEFADINPVFSSGFSHQPNEQEEKQELIGFKRSLLEDNLGWLEKERGILSNKEEEIEEYLKRELIKIRDSYQNEINDYSDELQKEYRFYIEEKEQEYLERLLARKELYENKIEGLIQKVEEDKIRELEEYSRELTQNYYPKQLNYSLKLKTLDLSEEEKEYYQEEMLKIEESKEEELEKKERELREEAAAEIAELHTEYNRKYLEFQQELDKLIKADMDKERQENEHKLQEYINTQQQLLQKELLKKEQEIRENNQGELEILERVINDLRRESHQLQSEIVVLEKE